MESSHRRLRRVAALALEVVASKSETQGHLSGFKGAIRSHLVFFSPDSRDMSKLFGKVFNDKMTCVKNVQNKIINFLVINENLLDIL